MAALFTGLYPDHAGVINHTPRDRLSTPAAVLAERAAAAGYATAAVVANPWLSNPAMGFDRGFERFVSKRDVGARHERFDAGAVTDRAIERWANADHEPLLLWVHYIDAHMPYQPPADTAATFGNASGTSAVVRDFAQGRAARERIYFTGAYPEAELQATRALYDAAIRHVDTEVGRLLDAVERSDRGRTTAIVVVADHGESLGDHGLYFAHDFTLYEELLHVPLIIEAPGVAPGRRRSLVSLVDVMPTLCSLMRLDCDGAFDGAALPLAADARDTGDARVVFAAGAPERARYGRSPFTFVGGPEGRWTMARRGSEKLIRIPHPDGPRWQAFDLDADPAELHADTASGDHEGLRRDLEAWGARMRVERAPAGAPPATFSDDQLEDLRALGYLD